MHHTTAKMITLERIEALLARGWPEGSQAALAGQARALRRKIPAEIVAAYDELKAEHKVTVVAVFEEKCGGCHLPLTGKALARLREEKEASRCDHCGRFLYLAGGHDLAAHGGSHEPTGGNVRG